VWGVPSNLAHTFTSLVKLGVTKSFHRGALIFKSWCDAHACDDTMHMLMQYGAPDAR
jgi:hypothetical protein